MNMNMNNNNRSKKNKDNHSLSDKEKADLWNIFDTECNKEPLECIFSNPEDRTICELCQSILAYSDEGFPTCTNDKCGTIYKDIVDHSPEWRYYGADDNQGSDPTRCGMPINPYLEESSYGCKILCSGNASYEMRKIKRYTEWQSTTYKEKSRYDDFQRISNYANIAGFSKKIIDDAIKYHKQVSDYDKSFRGDNKDGLIAASVYMSCRFNNYPRTAKELASIFHLDAASATLGCKNAQTIINDLENEMDNVDKTTFCKTKPIDFIERYCSKLNINMELTKLCKFIATKIEKQGLMAENTPNSIAAGIVYFVSQFCNLNVAKRDVKNVSEISEVTINKCYKKLDSFKIQLVPPVILNKYNKPSNENIS
jgi:transcription initiation factor TFIIB